MRYFLIAMMTCVVIGAKAQLQLSGRIKGLNKSDTLYVNMPFDAWYYQQHNRTIITDNKGFFSAIIPVEKPQTIFVIYKSRKFFVYASPQKTLSITLDGNKMDFGGSLEKENNFRNEIGLTYFELYPKHWNDTLSSPQEISTAIAESEKQALAKLAREKGSAFKTITLHDIAYFLPAKLWSLCWKLDVFTTGNRGKIDVQPWKDALRNAYEQRKLSNDEAVDSYFYQDIIANYPNLLELTPTDKKQFQSTVERLFEKPFSEALKEIKAKGERFWEYKVLKKDLKGVAQEFAIASFIDHGIQSGDLEYLQEAYLDFTNQYPASKYSPYINKITGPYISKNIYDSPESILFDSIGTVYSNLDEILQRHKGRVIYIDLWGSWCGPCREQFDYNKELKQYFANKPVDFIYIAFEKRMQPEKLWRSTVNFYNLTGRHILADPKLKAMLEKLYSDRKGMVFPSYLLVNKQGEINTLYAQWPSTKETLYQQINKLLD